MDDLFAEYPLAHGRVAIHDPAIVEDHGTYYIFGTHRRNARSTDLVHWERFENNLSRDPESVLGDIWRAWPSQPENPDLRGNTWAPDVIRNDTMGKWCMYLSVNGHEFRSVIVLLTADRLDGDWTYVGPVVYSGFDASNVDRTDVPRVLGDEAAHGDLTRYLSLKDTRINAIDAAPILCEHGEMWMGFGSWFGGIWMLKLDPATGLRDYTVRYPLVKDAADPYYGVKVAGGYWNSGEGSYFVRRNGWWYLFLSYGWLGTTGGYQIRMFRSRHLLGPYVDQNGNPAISAGEIPDNLTKDTGVRLTSSVMWSGGPAAIGDVEVSQGHNSVLRRGSDGRLFLTYHTRFPKRDGEDYETHIRELLPTEDGWLVAAPYEYLGAPAVPPAATDGLATDDPTVRTTSGGTAKNGTPADDVTADDSATDGASTDSVAATAGETTADGMGTDGPAKGTTAYGSDPSTAANDPFPPYLAGDYELVRHDPHTFYNGERDAEGNPVGVNRPETITLHADGRVTSGGVVAFFDTPDANLPRSTDGPALRGTWRMLGGCGATGVRCCSGDMAITLDGVTYVGVFAELPREIDRRPTVTFSAIGGNRTIWGSRL
ncbi:glycoside hydrolase family 43 protein [Bifidobacterium sp. 6T3]|uniref:Glycoside hydrolase family 43 protein n=1 Tax=Bifidobacterium phasiani TaxID=2834431 RepID=A0ABS6W6D4_9BIFI|nr:glycoside hydrolase family 43 protein [Bifidobacterium phasiani]MBW3082039.1 glycoside hydrolase family 43 protein [Bifidobacterium phasiani]